MLRSMTAFARAAQTTPFGHFVVEISSLNRRHLDLKIIAPDLLARYEMMVRKWVEARISRGAVTLCLQATFTDAMPAAIIPNLPLAKQLKQGWEQLAAALNLRDVGVERLLLSRSDLFTLCSQELPQFDSLLEGLVVEALGKLVAMKEREGEQLAEDLLIRLARLDDGVVQIAEGAQTATARYREKLQERIEAVLPSGIADQERLLQEVCLFADRIDCEEELTRLRAHLKQMRELLRQKERVFGKKLTFLAQELLREVNTIGSKRPEVELIKRVVEMKVEIERIREQLQNIE